MPELIKALREQAKYTGLDGVTELLQQAADRLETLEYVNRLIRDAERWRYARTILSIEDIEPAVDLMAGGTPSECENVKADAAIDRAMKGV